VAEAIALTAVRHKGLIVATCPDFPMAAFTRARSMSSSAPRQVEFIPALIEDFSNPTIVFVDGLLHLCSGTEYYLCSDDDTPLDRAELLPFASCITAHGRAGVEGVLNFGPRASQARFCGLDIHVHPPPPLGAGAFEQMLNELTTAASQLLFDMGGPTSIGILRSRAREREALYTLFRFIRYSMHEAPPDERLGTCFQQIERSPYHRTFRERVIVDVHSGKDIGPLAIESILSRPDSLTLLGERSALRQAALSRHLSRYGRAFFPERIRTERIQTTYDTPENRFVKYFLGVLGDTLETVAQAFSVSHDFIAEANKREALAMAEELSRYRRSPFLRNVGELSVFPGQSQVLRKRTGYRELTRLYHLLFLAGQLGWSELQLIENRRIDVLYEYWVFFKIVDILRTFYGDRRRLQAKALSGDRKGLLLELGRRGQVSLRFSKGTKELEACDITFCRSFLPGQHSYSVEFRPTVSIQTHSGRVLPIEVTYAAEWVESHEHARRATREHLLTRLHGLRDALDCQCALQILPGESPCFYGAGEAFPGFTRYRPTDLVGVGLLPLNPREPSDKKRLSALLHAFLSK